MISKAHPYVKLCASTDVQGVLWGGEEELAVIPLVLPQNAV